MLFCQQRKHHLEPFLYLSNEPIQIVIEAKFLEIIFDSKLTFLPHIKYLEAKCLKALSLLGVVAHTDWGADYTALMRIYTSCIRPKLNYGSVVFRSGRKSYLYLRIFLHLVGRQHLQMTTHKSLFQCYHNTQNSLDK